MFSHSNICLNPSLPIPDDRKYAFCAPVAAGPWPARSKRSAYPHRRSLYSLSSQPPTSPKTSGSASSRSQVITLILSPCVFKKLWEEKMLTKALIQYGEQGLICNPCMNFYSLKCSDFRRESSWCRYRDAGSVETFICTFSWCFLDYARPRTLFRNVFYGSVRFS
jgi:hypothetical protein